MVVDIVNTSLTKDYNNSKLNQLKEVTDQFEHCKKCLEDTEGKNKELENKLKQTTQVLEDKISSLENNIVELHHQLKQVLCQFEESCCQLEHLKKCLKETESKNKELENKLVQSTHNNEMLNDKVLSLKNSVVELQAKLQSLVYIMFMNNYNNCLLLS
jgi:chromosome segregation ATPase